MDRFGGEFGALGAGEESAADFGDAFDDGAHSNPPPSPVGQDERRMQVRAYNHWASLLGKHELPHIEELEPEFLGDFGPYSALLDFSTGSGTPTIQFIGKELRGECRLQEDIETLSEIPHDSVLSRIAERYLDVVSAKGPVSFEAEALNAKGTPVAFRGVLLPYSSDLDTIDFVYAVINWKELADAATADALLAEIDRAMEQQSGIAPFEVEPDPAPVADIVRFRPAALTEATDEAEDEAATDSDPWDSHDNILDMRGTSLGADAELDDLPVPSFGQVEPEEPEYAEETGEFTDEHAEIEPYYLAENEAEESVTEETPAAPKRSRQVDALGNPIGGASASEDQHEEPATGGITTAADYGLPDWDDEEPEGEDVDEVVNPLADIDLNSRLLSLVNAGTRGKKTVDLATLSETPEPEEAAESDAAKLFRPKAPSVDSLLSPEPYSEEDEDAEYYADSSDAEEDYAEAPTYADYEEPLEPVEEFVAEHEAVEFAEIETEAEAVADQVEEEAFAPLELSEEVPDEDVFAEVEETVDHIEVEEVSEADEEPLELGEELVLADESGPHVEECFEAEVSEDVLELVEAVEEPVTEAEVVEAREIEPAPELAVAQVDVEDAGEPEGLTGLLAAVRDLTEAARTTQDPSRRALYEAVGRAFDVSIKAVIASEQHGPAPRSVVEHFPKDAVSGTGPDMALVMVRRHLNGETEVLGEVPHDSILMESAQRKLASQ